MGVMKGNIMGELHFLHGAQIDICDFCKKESAVQTGSMTRDIFNEEIIFKCFECIQKGRPKEEVEPLTKEDNNKAGWCLHGRRSLSQGKARSSGKPWRKEDCPEKICSPIWWHWYWTGAMGYWISPREPEDYL